MNEQNQLERYLLGGLSEAERDTLENRLLADGELVEAMAIAEEELLDAYAADELTAERRQAVEAHLLTTPEQRQRLAFASALQAVANAESGGRVIGGAQRFRRWAAPLLAAAAALMLVVGGVLWQDNRQLGERIAGLEAERQELIATQQSLEAQRRADSERSGDHETARKQLEEDLSNANQRLEELTSELELAKRRSPRPPRRASFVLAAALRSATGPRDLAVPAATEVVDLTLEIGSEESYSAYVALLYGPDGRELWSRADLSGKSGEAGTAVTLEVPASAFGNGLHEVLLHGRQGAAEPELLGSYEFSVSGP
ncbi:MAG: zf-HC2 domain-containing protein [Acidobacteriota bacterium]